MPDAAYLTLKLARELYQKSPDGLVAEERQRVGKVAARQLEIERRILSTAEAAAVVLPASAATRSLAEIRGRYASAAEFRADLAGAGLSEDALGAAIERDLKVEAVLEGLASRLPAVSDTDVEIFYLMHGARFRRPESRRLRHILITINEELPDNGRAAAQARIDALRARLEKAPQTFAAEAARHSECPTAMNGGLLGDVPRGQLYPELEAAAFALSPGELSPAVESPLGFHVLLCEAAEADCRIPLAAVREKIRGHLADARRRHAQKAWIAGLFKPA